MSKVVEVSFPQGKRIDAKIGNFLIPTDQSISYGGQEAYPEPFDLFLASLATCAGIYALNFCQRRNISTKGMKLLMSCHWDKEKKLYTKISINLTISEDFPGKYQGAIIHAMELCSVKKYLYTPPEIQIETNRGRS